MRFPEWKTEKRSKIRLRGVSFPSGELTALLRSYQNKQDLRLKGEKAKQKKTFPQIKIYHYTIAAIATDVIQRSVVCPSVVCHSYAF